MFVALRGAAASLGLLYRFLLPDSVHPLSVFFSKTRHRNDNALRGRRQRSAGLTSASLDRLFFPTRTGRVQSIRC